MSVLLAIEPLALVGFAVVELYERELPVALRHFPTLWVSFQQIKKKAKAEGKTCHAKTMLSLGKPITSE